MKMVNLTIVHFNIRIFWGFSPIINFKKIKNFQYLQLDPIFYKKHS